MYKGDNNYTINDYISHGYENSSNLCTHPLPLTMFTEILNREFNIKIFKLENLNELKIFLGKHDIFINLGHKNNRQKYDLNTIRNSITKKNINKIKNIFNYEYSNFYN